MVWIYLKVLSVVEKKDGCGEAWQCLSKMDCARACSEGGLSAYGQSPSTPTLDLHLGFRGRSETLTSLFRALKIHPSCGGSAPSQRTLHWVVKHIA